MEDLDDKTKAKRTEYFAKLTNKYDDISDLVDELYRYFHPERLNDFAPPPDPNFTYPDEQLESNLKVIESRLDQIYQEVSSYKHRLN